jgi:plastocyanin
MVMRAHHIRRRLLPSLAVVMLAAGCAGSSITTPTTVATAGPTATPTATMTATQAPSVTSAPTPTSAPASQAAIVRCAETPGVAPSATVEWNIPVVGGEPTIKAGQAVAFVTGFSSPTVTEGTDGTPAANACIDKTIGSDAAAMSVVVTFYQPGDYSITCRKVPEEMHTVVHVQ